MQPDAIDRTARDFALRPVRRPNPFRAGIDAWFLAAIIVWLMFV